MVTSIVVDDDPDTVETFSEHLEWFGIKVLGKGYSGKDACSLYEKLKPDVVFLDMKMPSYDGSFALKKIKETHPNAKIIVITGDLSIKSTDVITGIKPFLIVHKPYSMQRIIDSLHNVMAKA